MSVAAYDAVAAAAAAEKKKKKFCKKSSKIKLGKVKKFCKKILSRLWDITKSYVGGVESTPPPPPCQLGLKELA